MCTPLHRTASSVWLGFQMGHGKLSLLLGWFLLTILSQCQVFLLGGIGCEGRYGRQQLQLDVICGCSHLRCILMDAAYQRGTALIHFGTSTCTEELFQRINELATVCETVKEFGASNDQSAAMMLKNPGQSKSSGTHVNSSVDESRAQKDGIGAAIEDGHNDGSSSFAQSKCSGANVNSSDDDSRTQTDEYSAAIGDGHDEGSRNYEQRKSSGNHVSSSDDDSGDS